MNILLVSDLHLEFHADEGRGVIGLLEAEDVDVLVVAGDLATVPLLRSALEALCERFADVVYVVGNHEYYHSSPAEVHELLAAVEARVSILHWLHHDAVELGGVRFVGTPLWFGDAPDNERYEPALNDFGLIAGFKPWVYEENARARRLLEAELPNVDVVVTHHMPTSTCVAPIHAASPLNRFFVYELDEVIERAGPPLWICGHTHASVDVVVGPTRILANPLGYPSEANLSFDGRCVVRIPA